MQDKLLVYLTSPLPPNKNTEGEGVGGEVFGVVVVLAVGYGQAEGGLGYGSVFFNFVALQGAIATININSA